MTVGFTLGKSLSELREMGPDEIGWWLAYIKRKHALEQRKTTKPKVNTRKNMT